VGAGLAGRQPWPAAFLLILVRVRRSCGLRRVGAAQATASEPTLYYKKKTNFLGRSSSALAPVPRIKTLWTALAAPLPNNTLKPPAKFGAGKFCRFKEQKTAF